jgi:hypothetical protein
VPTITKVQSDGDLRLIPSGCVIHKASSLPTRSIARWLSLPFHLISFGAAVARSGLSKEGLDGRPSVPHGFPTVAVLGWREAILSLTSVERPRILLRCLTEVMHCRSTS